MHSLQLGKRHGESINERTESNKTATYAFAQHESATTRKYKQERVKRNTDDARVHASMWAHPQHNSSNESVQGEKASINIKLRVHSGDHACNAQHAHNCKHANCDKNAIRYSDNAAKYAQGKRRGDARNGSHRIADNIDTQ